MSILKVVFVIIGTLIGAGFASRAGSLYILLFIWNKWNDRNYNIFNNYWNYYI